MPPVPTINQLFCGIAVNIVLKADQPTGRIVTGQISDILTRGNHTRGIKVRLTDGRVGRVKSLATPAQLRGEEPPTPAELEDFGARGFRYQGRDLMRDGKGPKEGEFGYIVTTGQSGSGNGGGTGYGGKRNRREYRGPTDVRQEEQPVEAVELEAFIKPSKPRGKKKGGECGQAMEREAPNAGGSSAVARGDWETEVSRREEVVLLRCPVCDEFEGDEAAVAHHVNGHFAD